MGAIESIKVFHTLFSLVDRLSGSIPDRAMPGADRVRSVGDRESSDISSGIFISSEDQVDG